MTDDQGDREDGQGLLDALRRGGGARASVEAVEPDVRSGVTFSLQPGGARNLVRERLVVIWGYDIVGGPRAAESFSKLLASIEEDIADIEKDDKSDIGYVGTFAVNVASDGFQRGHFRTIWSFGGYKDLDRFNELLDEASDESATTGPLTDALRQLLRFRDADSANSTEILLPASEARGT